MSNLMRRDPFREMMSLRSAMDRLFDNAFYGPAWGWEPLDNELALDVAETEDEYLVKASLPGINPDDLDISISGKTLTIKGEVKADEEKEGTHYHLRERRYGSFARSLTLPTSVQSDKVQAKYEAGLLTLHLPKTEEVKPRRIAVSKGDTPRMIEGKAKEVAQKN